MQSAKSQSHTQNHQQQSSPQESGKTLSLNKGSAAGRQGGPKKKGLSFQAKEAVREALAEKFGNKSAESNVAAHLVLPDSDPTEDRRGKSRFGAKQGQGRNNYKGENGFARKASPWATGERTGSNDRDGSDRGAKDTKRGSREQIDLDQVFTSEVPVGRMTKLTVSELVEQGAMLDAMDLGQLFLPRSQLPDELAVGDELRVFVYNEGSRFCATAKRPVLQLGMTGLLKINDIRTGTVYLDMGIPKDLVVPISEQRQRYTPRVGDMMMVLVAIDEQGRLYGTQNFNKFIRDEALPQEFKPQQPVKVVAIAHTPLGFRVIVDDQVYGLIYSTEQKGELVMGKRYDGFVKCVRPDGRIDVTLQLGGKEGIDQAAHDILQALGFSQGFLSFNDKSDPQVIEDYLHMSKGKFKKAIGSLYKSRYIELLDDGIKLTPLGLEVFNSEHGQATTADDSASEAADGAEVNDADTTGAE